MLKPASLTEQIRLKDERRVRDGLDRSRQRIAAALSLSCPECAASPGAYCTSALRGLCRVRFEQGLAFSLVTPTRTKVSGGASPALSIPGQTAQPDRRHPNRHPVRSAR